MKRRISKSRFQKGLQCEKALWLAINRSELATPVGETLQWTFDQGTSVGRLAQELFPGGTEVTEDFRNPEGALATTASLLTGGATVLYEPAFEHNGAFCRADILVAAADGRWDLYEVKSTASLKAQHVTDAAVQAYAVEGSGVPLGTINIVHLNNTYVWDGGPYDPQALFTIADVTDDVRAFMPQVPAALARFQAMLEGPMPAMRIGSQCTSPYTCDFYEHCHAFLPAEHPVTALPRLPEVVLHRLLDARITSITDIPDDFGGLSDAQAEAVSVVKSGVPHVDAAGLAREIGGVTWPVYHLDFETVAPALPLWPGTHPYQTVPFQYSVHVQDRNGRIEHREYLHEGADDPRRALAARLIADLGESGSVAHYTAYERTQLAALAAALPDLAPAIEAVIARLWDLERVIRAHTRHPRSAGRSSIKYVLPAWCPDCSYEDLEIADGQTASVRCLRVLTGVADAGEAEATYAALREYCGLDTWAMVRLLQEMQRLADASA
jgi:predicted RecB family nuclease